MTFITWTRQPTWYWVDTSWYSDKLTLSWFWMLILSWYWTSLLRRPAGGGCWHWHWDTMSRCNHDCYNYQRQSHIQVISSKNATAAAVPGRRRRRALLLRLGSRTRVRMTNSLRLNSASVAEDLYCQPLTMLTSQYRTLQFVYKGLDSAWNGLIS